jgi:hypothetical protein
MWSAEYEVTQMRTHLLPHFTCDELRRRHHEPQPYDGRNAYDLAPPTARGDGERTKEELRALKANRRQTFIALEQPKIQLYSTQPYSAAGKFVEPPSGVRLIDLVAYECTRHTGRRLTT